MRKPVTLTLLGAALTIAAAVGATPTRPQGPCDLYGAAGTPCVTAHSTTRALSASYNGPLYQVKRQSDGKTLDVGVVQPSDRPVPDAGGYANAAAQDGFCANTICVINVIYDQSGKGNHLYQAPPGPLFPGPAKGAFDTQPIADMAPITIGGHKAYGVYIMPGMGFRNNNARDIAINDEPEGIYYVIDGTHYDSGCCFDYGNSSTNGRAVGTGTMETTYFGTATAWGSGAGPGPWIMADMEAGLFSGYNAKQNPGSPTIDSWRFVTAVVNGGGGNKWDLRGGNAQKGGLTTFYSGIRPGSQTNDAYFPMHKQGAVLLGTGGDNGNGSAGTFYEGVMTIGYPTEATTDAVQANIVAARYDVQRVKLIAGDDVRAEIDQGRHRDVHQSDGVARYRREVEPLPARGVAGGPIEDFPRRRRAGRQRNRDFHDHVAGRDRRGILDREGGLDGSGDAQNAVRDRHRESAERPPDQDQRGPPRHGREPDQPVHRDLQRLRRRG